MIGHKQDEIEQRRPSQIETSFAGNMFAGDQEATDARVYLSIFYRRRRLILGVIAAVFCVGMLYTISKRPVYESTAKIVVVTSKVAAPVSDGAIPLVTDLQALTGSRSVQTQAEIMSSPELMQEASLLLPPELREKGFGSKGFAPDWASKVEVTNDTDVISVTGRAFHPEAAAALANSIASTYFTRDLSQNNRATRQARKFAETEMAVAGKKLGHANADLAQFKKRTELFAPEVQLPESAGEIARISTELQNTKTLVASTQWEMVAVRGELARQNKDIVASTTFTLNPQFSATVDRIDTLTSERTALLQEFNPGSKEIKAMDERIAHEKRWLNRVARTIVGSKVNARNPVVDTLVMKYATDVSSLAAARARVSMMEKDLARKKQVARKLPDRERGLSERVQQVTLLRDRYEVLSKNYYALLLGEQATLPNGTLVSRADVPTAAAYPKTKVNATFFLMLGILLGLVSAVVAERVDAKVHDQDTAESASGLTALSVVPDMRKGPTCLMKSEFRDGPMLESFRILRNSLCVSGTDLKYRILAITSPGHGEGKSTTTLNLGVTMAMDGKRVLVVDGDVRRQSLHKMLCLPNIKGLTSVLTGEVELNRAIRPTNIPNLYCLTSGPNRSNFVELLNSPAGRKLFETMTENYDCVLVDCPPAAGLSDIQAISNLVDGVLLVVSLHQSAKPQLDFTMRLLAQTGTPLVGIVVNRTEAVRYSYSYYCETTQDAVTEEAEV